MAMAQKKQKLMWEALREAIDEEMEKDPAVCVMGESSVIVSYGKGEHPELLQLLRPASCSSSMDR